ncbi:AAA domain-containing protein [Silvanigrella paludirubra]|jgi:MoxR-like ATPase|uniref:AAA domain-containing protein n=1 Tax=Silvanigrella paludirubra TaxID=2499159 RepID=A0A6N6VPD6_9BACT|nr:AAA family ATPase [Silvanigrella paludirubra]KAB8036067.1 AAA domain-containing protein [Silvanigrella paludirubra]
MSSNIIVDKEKESAQIGNINVKLAKEYEVNANWMGNDLASHQLRAAWLKLSEDDLPMNPRLVGKPGVGKTTLAVAVAKELHSSVYLMQGTSDTRPDDLIITPVITEGKQISYVASPIVTAMLVGGVCILDEGNRMSEKSWASLASLLDHRRYVDSVIAGLRIHAHKEFRFVTTMNDDSSVYDLPEYIQSRLNPQIFLDFADIETEARIIRYAVPYLEENLLTLLVSFLAISHKYEENYSVRDGIQIAKYAQRLKSLNKDLTLPKALKASVFSILGEDALKYFPPDEQMQNDPQSSTRPNLRPV